MELIKQEKWKKGHRKTALELKRGLKHVTKDVPENERLSQKELLPLANDSRDNLNGGTYYQGVSPH